tara:strand:+ start:774 stop:1655 length:882 start_codon:yes stop_codon:yes gene_type:complete
MPITRAQKSKNSKARKSARNRAYKRRDLEESKVPEVYLPKDYNQKQKIPLNTPPEAVFDVMAKKGKIQIQLTDTDSCNRLTEKLKRDFTDDLWTTLNYVTLIDPALAPTLSSMKECDDILAITTRDDRETTDIRASLFGAKTHFIKMIMGHWLGHAFLNDAFGIDCYKDVGEMAMMMLSKAEDGDGVPDRGTRADDEGTLIRIAFYEETSGEMNGCKNMLAKEPYYFNIIGNRVLGGKRDALFNAQETLGKQLYDTFHLGRYGNESMVLTTDGMKNMVKSHTKWEAEEAMCVD